jgi:plastocyanin
MFALGCGDDSDSDSKSDDTPAATTTSDDTMDDDAAASGTVLKAEVGPGFTIELKDADGNDVDQLDAGDYTIEVSDKSDIHNFHLMGGDVDKMTEVDFEGDDTWNVKLTAGDYTYVCDPHASSMKGEFTVV